MNLPCPSSWLRWGAAVALACILAACPTETPSPKSWAMTFEELPGALFSVWGTSAADVWLVGETWKKDAAGKVDPTGEPTVLHYDGKGWQRLHPGGSGTLWWVTGLGDDVWMAGSKGLILRYRRSTGAFEKPATPSGDQLFGIFPLAPDDVWAVGGVAGCSGESGALLWHWDGKAWSVESRVDAGAQDKVACWFKVWARSKTDAFVVGNSGHAVRWDGKTWKALSTGVERTLFTVHGNATLAVAVGGFGTGALVESSGAAAFVPIPKKPALPQLNGVWVPATGDAFAAGIGGAIWRRQAGTWKEVSEAPLAAREYHSVYVDPDGGVWAVGGQISAPPFVGGQLGHYGPTLPTKIAE
ncbi:MAG: hypothetical protein EXR79_11010 [Myxococcales bacterium]|nr:hypothetical protein [Myxococcales bacterium]